MTVTGVRSCRTVAAPCWRSCGDFPKDRADLTVMGRDVDGGTAGWEPSRRGDLAPARVGRRAAPEAFRMADASEPGKVLLDRTAP